MSATTRRPAAPRPVAARKKPVVGPKEPLTVLDYFLDFIVALETANEIQEVFSAAAKLDRALKASRSPKRLKLVTDANHIHHCSQRLGVLLTKFEFSLFAARRQMLQPPT